MSKERKKAGPRSTHGVKCPRCGELMRKSGKVPSGKTRWRCNSGVGPDGPYCYSTTDPSKPPRNQKGEKTDAPKNPQFRRSLKGITRYVITAAQNATPVHEGFLAALKGYCERNKAELIVIPLRYKNPTSLWTGSQANEEYWAPELVPFLYNQRKKLGPNMVLLGDIKTVATAVNPLTGFDAITHSESGILGHTKMALRTIPTQGRSPKILASTGVVTVPNYTDTKSGALGAFHHVQGALIVETKGSKFHLRQLNANKDGSFTDLDTEYYPNEMWGAASAPLALVLGDTHHRFMDKKVEKATFLNDDSIVNTLKPERLVFHDLLDMYSRNPHERSNVFAEIGKRQNGLQDVAREVKDAIEWLAARDAQTKETLVVPSNHDNMLLRWIRDCDWRQDPDNAEFYLQTALALVRGTSLDNSGHHTIDPFIYWIEKLTAGVGNVNALKPDQSYKIGGIELGMHGDRGPNGARGSINNLKRIGVKSVIGHSHTPGISEGCYQTGTSSELRLSYNKGPSSWLHTHCLIYGGGSAGKRTLINIIDGSWRL